jgi:hypothetical protein
MHRAHENTVLQCGKTKVQAGEKVWIVFSRHRKPFRKKLLKIITCLSGLDFTITDELYGWQSVFCIDFNLFFTSSSSDGFGKNYLDIAAPVFKISNYQFGKLGTFMTEN